MDRNAIQDTIRASWQYLNELKGVEDEICKAEAQITSTFNCTIEEIEETFTLFKTQVLDVLNSRELALKKYTKQVRDDSLEPLKECREIVKVNLEKTCNLLKLGDKVLKEEDGLSLFDEFFNESSLIGTLPEVPDLREVAFLTFQSEDGVKEKVLESCLGFGEVSRIAPIQISHILEKPGGLLVEWESLEAEDRISEISGYCLQKNDGVSGFKTCYEGTDSQFLVKDVGSGKDYSFRVACKFEGSEKWSVWSLVRVARTTLKPFCWSENQAFQICNEGRIASCLKEETRILYSEGPQFGVGHSIEFTLLEADPKTNCLIGLLPSNKKSNLDDLSDLTSSFWVTQSGQIFLDGQEKSTILPQFQRNLKLSFTLESPTRFHIDSNDKRVTYNWPNNSAIYYFFVQPSSRNWKVLVE